MTVSLRRAVPEDVTPCVAMMADSTPWRELGYRPERCSAILWAGLAETQVAAEAAVGIAGFVCLQPAGFIGQPYVKLLCVAEAARGGGVGRALMAWAEARAFEHLQARNLFLLVSDFNTPARAFYTRLGFGEVGRLPDYLIAGSTEIVLRKTRGPLLGKQRNVFYQAAQDRQDKERAES